MLLYMLEAPLAYTAAYTAYTASASSIYSSLPYTAAEQAYTAATRVR